MTDEDFDARDNIRNPREHERGPRAAELLKMRKADVFALWQKDAGKNHVWSAVPPKQWSKDDLIHAILRHEIGDPVLCGAPGPADRRCSIGAGVIHTTHRYDIEDNDRTHMALYGHSVNFGCCVPKSEPTGGYSNEPPY